MWIRTLYGSHVANTPAKISIKDIYIREFDRFFFMFGSIQTDVHSGWGDPNDDKGDCWIAKFDKMGEI